MVTILFESHGTTLDNEAHIASGHFDVELLKLGQVQAQELGKRYHSISLDAIFCSDLKRSYETVKIVFEEQNIPIVIDSRLRECDYGDWTRRPSTEVEKEKENHIMEPFPNGESYTQTADRMKLFLEDLRNQSENKTVLIIGHRATQYGLEHWIHKVSLEQVVTAPWKWQPGRTYQLSSL
jgi:broad specificity phosphatase PhoE